MGKWLRGDCDVGRGGVWDGGCDNVGLGGLNLI